MPATLLNQTVKQFLARGLSDAYIAQAGNTNAPIGGCLSLRNLVPDRHTLGVYAPRPAYTNEFDVSTAPGITVTAPGEVTFATAPASGVALTWTDDNTPTAQSLGTGDGTTTVFAFMKLGNAYQPVNPKVYMSDWQGNQLQYATPRTNVAKYNVTTSGFTGVNLTVGSDATAGPDGEAAVYGLEDTANTTKYLNTVASDSSVSTGDYFTFVIDFALTPGYLNNENKLLIEFFNMGGSIIGGYPQVAIDIAAHTIYGVVSPEVTANFVSTLPNGFVRYSFVVHATANSGAGPYLYIGLNANAHFTGDGTTKLYVRHDIKKTQTVSSWIKNTTGSAVTVTDYQLTNTSVGTQIGNISALYVLGSRVYGMALGNNAGNYFDAPFCYDFDSGAFITISGMTTSNVPNSTGYPNGATSGGVVASDWTPPVMEQVGSKIIVTHPGFAGTGNYIGWIDISSPATPSWSAGNLSGGGGLSFTVPPVSVVQFNGRAYYAVGGSVTSNNIIFSDSLNPTVCTNSTQVLTVGDNQPILGFGQIAYANTTSVGGIVQSILAFKKSSIAQITGDSSTSNLAVNVIKSGVGCRAPQTICNTPLGVMFLNGDGVRYIDNYGRVSNPLPSLRNPFANCNLLSASCYPSTACAAYNSNMYRISLYTTDLLGNVSRQEFVFDLEFGWHGAHIYDAGTKGIALICPYGSGFLMSTRNIYPTSADKNSTEVMQTILDPGPLDTFVENGTTLTWEMQSCTIEDDAPMMTKELQEATLLYNPGNAAGNITVTATPSPTGVSTAANQTSPASATMSYSAPGSLWGTAVWGAFQWGGASLTSLTDSTVPFPDPITYKTLQVKLTGSAALSQRIGAFNYRSVVLPMTNTDLAA